MFCTYSGKLFYPDDGGSAFLRNADVWRHTTQESSLGRENVLNVINRPIFVIEVGYFLRGMLCKGKGSSPLQQAVRAQPGSRGIVLLILNIDARWCGRSAPRPGWFTPGAGPIIQEAGQTPGPVWTVL